MPLLSSLSVAGAASVSTSKPMIPVLSSSAFIPSSKIVLLEKYQKKYAGVHDIIKKIHRGGGLSTSELDEEDEGHDAVEGEEESSNDEYESEEEEEEEDEDEVSDTDVDEDEEEEQEDKLPSSSLLKSSMLSKSKENGGLTTTTTTTTTEYDTVLTPPAMQQLFISIGVMLLSNRIDILDAKAVRMARIAFVAYIIVVQLFLLYVRLKAKSINDRTPVMISSPLASLLPAAVTGGSGGGGGGGNSMVKTLADQVLSTQTTILEYDLKQAKQMNGSLLFPMIFNYFLHFKMKQVQPLIMQTATGMVNLAYSPLFQVYVLGRNLERPFKQPTNPMMDALQKQEQEQNGEGAGDKSADVEEDVEMEVEGTSDDEGEEEEDDDDDDENDGDDDDEYENSDQE